VIYRGVKSVSFPLIPKIGRIDPPQSAKSREWNEKEILRLFKEQALTALRYSPVSKVWRPILNGYNRRVRRTAARD